MLRVYSLDILFQKRGRIMSDISSDSFIVPYPSEDVYGIGVAGPSSTNNNNESDSENKVENVSGQTNNIESEEVNNSNEVSKISAEQPGSENIKIEEHLGNNIDTTA